MVKVREQTGHVKIRAGVKGSKVGDGNLADGRIGLLDLEGFAFRVTVVNWGPLWRGSTAACTWGLDWLTMVNLLL